MDTHHTTIYPREMAVKKVFVRHLLSIAAVALTASAIIPPSHYRYTSVLLALGLTVLLLIGGFLWGWLVISRARVDSDSSGIIVTNGWGQQKKHLANRIETVLTLPRVKSFFGPWQPSTVVLDINGKRLVKINHSMWRGDIAKFTASIPAAKFEESTEKSATNNNQLRQRYRHYPGIASYREAHPIMMIGIAGLAIAVVAIALAVRL